MEERKCINPECGSTDSKGQWYAGPLCKSCYRKQHRQVNIEKYKARDAANYAANSEQKKAWQNQYYADHTEECKARSKAHKKLVGDQHLPGYFPKRRLTHKDEQNAASRRWRKNNLQYDAFRSAKRRARKLQATPPWLTADHWAQIEEIYFTCPKGYHVDHIVPLVGEEVSGLHVPWNLQHLPADVNVRKSNKF